MDNTANILFSLHDYHAIKQADIVLDGLTVLAGNNGCGKSTLSRWLYYIINGMANFERFERKYVISELNNAISPISRILEEDIGGEFPSADDSLDTIGDWYLAKIESCWNKVEETIKRRPIGLDGLRYRRLTRELNLSSTASPEEVIQSGTEIFNQYRKKWDILRNRCEKMLSNHNTNEFLRLIKENYPECEDFPQFKMAENGIPLFSEHSFEKLYPITRAIYIDTATLPFEYGIRYRMPSRASYYRDLNQLIQQHSDNAGSEGISNLIFSLSRTIGGSIQEKKEDFGSLGLRYKRADGLDISINSSATGIKSFAILYRLLQNGHLNKNTLLIVDEPESHLHPQWVVEYARLLVLINKTLGTRIMIASHDPDMVAAIQAIAIKEQVTDTTHFYVASECERLNDEVDLVDRSTYQFKDSGIEIEEIFKSFNIALDRINQYGGSAE